MKLIESNPYLSAIRDTLALFAAAHILVLAVRAVITGDFMLLHLYTIMDAGFITGNPAPSGAVSYAVSTGIILAMYWLILRRRKEQAD